MNEVCFIKRVAFAGLKSAAYLALAIGFSLYARSAVGAETPGQELRRAVLEFLRAQIPQDKRPLSSVSGVDAKKFASVFGIPEGTARDLFNNPTQHVRVPLARKVAKHFKVSIDQVYGTHLLDRYATLEDLMRAAEEDSPSLRQLLKRLYLDRHPTRDLSALSFFDVRWEREVQARIITLLARRRFSTATANLDWTALAPLVEMAASTLRVRSQKLFYLTVVEAKRLARRTGSTPEFVLAADLIWTFKSLAEVEANSRPLPKQAREVIAETLKRKRPKCEVALARKVAAFQQERSALENDRENE